MSKYTWAGDVVVVLSSHTNTNILARTELMERRWDKKE